MNCMNCIKFPESATNPSQNLSQLRDKPLLQFFADRNNHRKNNLVQNFTLHLIGKGTHDTNNEFVSMALETEYISDF